jgi:sugar transferase (PEP-CTERM/EpsH1 system associated)
MPVDHRPLVAHVVYRFDTGGLENGIVNLINHMPASSYRHAVVALTEVTDFSKRITCSDVEFIALHKQPGHGVWLYPKLYRLFKKMRPAIVHTRNLAALEAQAPAWAAGVPVRLHGEHGRDVSDLHGENRRLQRVRRVYRPFVHHYFALSRDLAGYLKDKVHVPAGRITQVYNGVDVERFCPPPGGVRAVIAGCPFNAPEHWLIGTVGRMQTVKDQTNLARAFVLALQQQPALRERLRLVLIGEGALREQCATILREAGVLDLAWLPGERSDVADVMRGLDCFVLPSLAEGISNTILEAMATALPVIATDVGGNADLVVHGQTGEIVPSKQPQALARSMLSLVNQPEATRALGLAGRQRVQARFSLPAMVATYQLVYNQQLRSPGHNSGLAAGTSGHADTP